MTLRSILIITLLLSIPYLCSSQDEDGQRTKIIERTVDEDGNVISERIYYEYGQGDQDLFDLPGRFDLEGLGFDDLFEERSFFKRKDGKPIIGVTLNFEGGTGKVVSVSPNSGAEDQDIREGDEVISVEGVAISSFEDIQDILGDKKVGDVIGLVVFRDGEELIKEVRLSGGSTGSFFFDMPEGGIDFFGQMDLDSLFDGSSDFWGEFFGDSFNQLDRFRGGQNNDFFSPDDDDLVPERATLGILIDDVGSGVLVTEVLPGSVSDKAGLKIGDVITQVDETKIGGYDDLLKYMEGKKVGDDIAIHLERAGEMTIIGLRL